MIKLGDNVVHKYQCSFSLQDFVDSSLPSSCISSISARQACMAWYAAKHNGFPHLTDVWDLSDSTATRWSCLQLMSNLEGTQGVCTGRVTLSRVATNIQDSLVYSIEFCCEHAVKTMKVTEHLAVINEGTTSRTMKQWPINVYCSTVWAVRQIGKRLAICKGWCCLSHAWGAENHRTWG
jgi:hypothetical protein